jgi:regulatory protein
MDSDTKKSCYGKALQILARRDHSCSELRKKLNSRGFEEPVIETVIRECRRLNYLNDTRFTELYVNQLQRKGFGINGIKHKLYAKGIPEKVFQDKLAPHGTDNAQRELCRRVLAKKIKPIAGESPSESQAPKLYRYLLNRGFPSHIIRQTINEMIIEKR